MEFKYATRPDYLVLNKLKNLIDSNPKPSIYRIELLSIFQADIRPEEGRITGAGRAVGLWKKYGSVSHRAILRRR